jgi:aminopeptidase N
MRERGICKLCELGSLTLHHQGSSGRRPFAIPGSSPHYAPDRPFRVEHILLDLIIDPIGQRISGKTTQKVRVIAPEQRWIKLDQIGLQIEEVSVGGETAQFNVQDNSLNIDLGHPLASGKLLEVSVRYHLSQPRRGIYFTGPDSDYPKKRYQVWTQGQDEDSRYWFPTLDYPNQKATSEVIATVPRGFTAISNGALISRNEVSEGVRFHYSLGTPHVTYLMTLVVGEFSEWSDSGPRALPVQYFVAPGCEEDGKRAFANTPKMIEAFESKTGVPYPYEKYSQVAVQDFIFGGMENTSATTQTDLTLHDKRAHLDFSSDPLVAHELAHQWFGDLVTCRDWSHGWLNEGFATFMERVWVESNPGEGGGFEEGKYYSYQDLKAYFSEDQKRYRRPIVCNTYVEPIDLFDTHLYQKGGLVLNLIRHVLGDDWFWKSVKVYLERHRGQNVETLDLIRAIEDTTGRNLRRFFDEWVFSAGFPEFEVSYQWHEDKKLTEWVIEQKQTQGAPSLIKDGVTTQLFHLPVTLELTLDGCKKVVHKVEIAEARERIFLPSPSKPLMVRFDPDHWIPKVMKFPRPKEMLLYQLVHDSDCMGRIEAAQELIKIADPSVVHSIGNAVRSDLFWGVQAECAKALTELKTNASRDQLIAALSVVKHPKARRAIVASLGTFRDEKAAEALKKVAEGDSSYYVEADATYAWAFSRIKPGQTMDPVHLEQIEAFLLKQLEKSSYRDVIRSATLSALAELPGVGRGDCPTAFNAIIQWSGRGNGVDVRAAAVRAMGKVLKTAAPAQRTQIVDIFSHLGDEDNFRLRMQLTATLEESGCHEAIPVLQKVRQLDLDGRVRRAAQVGVDHLLSSGTVPESIDQLKGALGKLEVEYRDLRSKFEEEKAFRDKEKV